MRWPRPRPPAAQAPHLELAGQRLPVEIRKLAQARRITLRLARDGSAVRISMPRWAAEAEALRFALSRREWLAAQ
ncbi:MAG TPA: metal-dependent hydrolase, partial [Novosphingobium sp.]|nr:metal-dependent hydrolase [Novosphingobium sp.]